MAILLLSITDNSKGETSLQQSVLKQDEPKFCNIILADVDEKYCLEGMRNFVAAAKSRGIYKKMHMTFLIHSYRAQQDKSNERDFYKQLYKDGNEIGVITNQDKGLLAKWLDIPVNEIVTSGFDLFGDPAVESQAAQTKQGIRAGINACVEGSSLAEFWDIPHNWEGAPMFPYWVQWDDKNPLRTARTNREMDRNNATLELHFMAQLRPLSYTAMLAFWRTSKKLSVECRAIGASWRERRMVAIGA